MLHMASSPYYSSLPPSQDCAECRARALIAAEPPTSPSASPNIDTVQCTDKCIVVACDQADHLDNANFDDMFRQCIGGRECEELCNVTHEPIEWPCADPGCATNELLQCCLNEIPSSSLRTQDQSCDDSHGHEQHWPWMHCEAPAGSVDYSQVRRKTHIDLPPPVVTDGRNHDAPFNGTLAIRCMWGSCTRSFLNRGDLLSHLQTEHLHPFSCAGTPQHYQHQYVPLTTVDAQSSYGPDRNRIDGYFSEDPTAKAFSCLWDECGLNIPVQSQCSECVISHQESSNNFDENFLLSHLLTNHLHRPTLNAQEYTPTPFIPETASESGATAEFSPLPSGIVASGSSGEPVAFLCGWKDCTERFDSSDDLNTHITEAHIGQGKSSYECLWRGCDRNGANGFPSKQKVMRHMQKHSGFKPHVCTVCQERFAETTSLQQHMRRHTQEKPYVCDFPGCGKTFSIPGGLRIHKRAHSGEKPFKCPEPGCGKAFSESSNLAKHMRIHSGLKPFHCVHPGCGRRFGRKDQLTRHAALHRAFTHQEEAAVVTVAS